MVCFSGEAENNCYSSFEGTASNQIELLISCIAFDYFLSRQMMQELSTVSVVRAFEARD